MPINRMLCLLGALGAAVVVGCTKTTPTTTTPTTRGSFNDLSSNDPDTVHRRQLMFYSLGLDLGQRVATGAKRDGIAIEEASIRQGLMDGLAGKSSRYTEEEIADATAALEYKIAQNVAKRRYEKDPSFREMADKNLAKSREAMADYAMRAGVTKLPNGVLIKEMKPGKGRYVANAQTLTGNFTVSLISGVQVRESEDGKPVTVKTAKMMPVVLDAIQEMREGATWRVAIPPELAYGLGGNPPAIGPNQALILELELIKAE